MNIKTQQQTQALQNQEIYQQYRYRWVVVALMSLAFVINALANNAVIPIAHKLAETYGLSDTKVDAPVFISFLVYSLMNFPANHFIDKYGLRFSLILGTFLYAIGLLFYALINVSYNLVILGAIIIAIGQPFVINCPAKVAAFWFNQQNRTLATGIMLGINIIATGIGFVVPTLAVNQSSQIEQSRIQAQRLYLGYLITAIAVFVLQLIFMKASPPTPVSKASQGQKISVIQSFRMIKQDKNLRKFFLAYILLYGSFLTSGAITNQLLKPFGYQDTQIAILGVLTIVGGVAGTLFFTHRIKTTNEHEKIIKKILWLSITLMLTYTLWLNLVGFFQGTAIIAGLLGFMFAPIIPISYDLGCQLAFPIGEAQVVGILNGGSMILTFFLTLVISHFIGFGTLKQSAVFFTIFNVIIICGAVKYSSVEINLKRTIYQNESCSNNKKAVKDKADVEMEQRTGQNEVKGYQVMIQQN